MLTDLFSWVLGTNSHSHWHKKVYKFKVRDNEGLGSREAIKWLFDSKKSMCRGNLESTGTHPGRERGKASKYTSGVAFCWASERALYICCTKPWWHSSRCHIHLRMLTLYLGKTILIWACMPSIWSLTNSSSNFLHSSKYTQNKLGKKIPINQQTKSIFICLISPSLYRIM